MTAERTPRELRKFGFLVGGLFLLYGTVAYWRAHEVRAAVTWTLGVLLVVPAIVVPRVLAPVERGWTKLGHTLGHYNAQVILTLLYYLVVTPIGVIMRRFNDPLDRALADGRASEWVPRHGEPMDPARYREQF